jgi:hypothetical protein
MLVEEAENSLIVEKMEVEGVFGKVKTIFNVGGRNKKHLKMAYNNEQLPVLPYGCPSSTCRRRKRYCDKT